jgi:hypothetical protein
MLMGKSKLRNRNMVSWRGLALTLALLLVISMGLAGESEAQYAPVRDCRANSGWVTDPSAPTKIPGGGTNLCQFYQFAWQMFLYLGAPTAPGSGIRNFQDQAAYPILTATQTDSCGNKNARNGLFVRVQKSDDLTAPFVIPESINEAGMAQATIYDQNGNVAFFEVRFSRDMCTTPLTGNLPAGTTELKFSWRQIDPSEKSRYFWMETEVELTTGPKTYLLGLIGMHVVRTTPTHPEAIWATFEHVDNAPDCVLPARTWKKWSFASSEAYACLATTDDPTACQTKYKLNGATKQASLTGVPTEICRMYRSGTGPADANALQNFLAIESLNLQLVGPNGFLTGLAANNPMAVWKNYFNVGGIWVNDPSKPSTAAGNQVGSLELTNTVAETTYQGTFTGHGFQRTPVEKNCFTCHPYTPKVTAVLSGTWSHILGDFR